MNDFDFDADIEPPVPPLRSARTSAAKEEKRLLQLEKRLHINFDYFLFSAITILLIAAAIFFDDLAIYILAILFSPLQIHLLGLAFNIGWKPVEKWQSLLFAWLFNNFGLFLVGLLIGFIIKQMPNREIVVWRMFCDFSLGQILLIVVGVVLTIMIFQRNPNQNVLVANIAIVYGLNLPLAASGAAFGLAEPAFGIQIIINYLLYFLIALFVGLVTIFVLKIGNNQKVNFIALGAIAVFSIVLLYVKYLPDLGLPRNGHETSNVVLTTATQQVTIAATQAVSLPTLIPTAQDKENTVAVKSPTATLPPTITPTITLTPIPTPVWAEIKVKDGEGANIREEASFESRIVRTVLNGTLLEVLHDTIENDGNTWIHVRLQDGTEGWIVRNLIKSATPEPEW